MAANACTQKPLPLWLMGLQDKTPMCYSARALFIVLFLLGYKILVWTTLLFCVWKSHIWSLLVCHEWLWGIRANAVAWVPSYNNTDSFEGPTKRAKTTASAVPALYTSNIVDGAPASCCVYWPACLAQCHDITTPLVSGWYVDQCKVSSHKPSLDQSDCGCSRTSSVDLHRVAFCLSSCLLCLRCLLCISSCLVTVLQTP